MAMIGKARRDAPPPEQDGAREIASETGLSRNAVRKYLRMPLAGDPKYRRVPVPTRLAPFHAALQYTLGADAQRPKSERRTALALYAEIKAGGYAGGYTWDGLRP